MNSKNRINELIKRQVYYGSSLVCKLTKVQGTFFYEIWAWYALEDKIDTKFIVMAGSYQNQDPEDLFKIALSTLSLRKIKLGIPI